MDTIELCTDKQQVADHFNQYFTSVATSLVDKLSTSVGKFGRVHVVDFYKGFNITANMFKIENVTFEDVSNIISMVNVNKATGLDGLSVRFAKGGWPAISVLITHIIINVSIDRY